MTIRCPNKACNLKMSIHDAVIANPNSTTKCPSCKKIFNAHELYYKNQELTADIKGNINPKIQGDNGRAMDQKPTAPKTKVMSTENKQDAKAWLVVHDEQAEPQSYDLIVGKNRCGKEPNGEGNKVLIKSSDPYMSRQHFEIEVVENNGRYSFVLKDTKSTNKTHIDTKVLSDFERHIRPLADREEIYIEDGALIQAGLTKIYFKVANNLVSRDAVATKIQNQKYTKTVII